jgi:hypothetical protein
MNRILVCSVLALLWPSHGWAYDWAKEITQQQNKDLLEGIQNLVKLIEADTDRTMKNTEVIRSVLVEKQKLALALNQISLLQTNGKVLTEVAPTSQIVSQVNDMVSNPTSVPKPITLGKMPSLAKPSDAIRHIKDLVQKPSQMANQVQSLGSDFIGWFSGAADTLTSSPWGVLDLADQGVGFFDQAGNFVSSVSAIFGAIDQMVYTGKTFIGTNWGNIDDVAGLLGSQIALDRKLPFVELPVTGRLAETIYDARSGYQQLQNMQRRMETIRQGAQNYFAANSVGSRFVAGSDAAQREVAYAFADGVYVRPETELDAAYFHLVQTGTPAERLAFEAATTMKYGSCYDPVVGWFQDGEKLPDVNLNETLSNGAFGAVERYRVATNSKMKNGYDTFASTLAPVAVQILAGAEPGKKIIVSAALVKEAKKAQPLNLKQYGSLAALANPAAEQLFAYELDVIEARQGLRLRPIANTGNNNGIVVVGLPKAQASEYTERIKASDVRVSENSRMLNICVATINYTQNALEAATRLRAALVGVAELSTQYNALETVPAMIQNCDNTILFLQRQVSDYSLEIERLKKERNNELSARAEFVRQTRVDLERNARSRISSALLSATAKPAATPVPNESDEDNGSDEFKEKAGISVSQ